MTHHTHMTHTNYSASNSASIDSTPHHTIYIVVFFWFFLFLICTRLTWHMTHRGEGSNRLALLPASSPSSSHSFVFQTTHTQYMNSCWHSAAMCSAMRHIHTHTHIHVSPHRTPYGRAPLSIEPISCTLFHGCAPLPSLLPVLFAHSLFGRVCCQ